MWASVKVVMRQEFAGLANGYPSAEYFAFNGSVEALSKLHPLQAKVGETVRAFFGVGGPNFTCRSIEMLAGLVEPHRKLGHVAGDSLGLMLVRSISVDEVGAGPPQGDRRLGRDHDA